MSTAAACDKENVKYQLKLICQDLSLEIELRDFQVTFFERVLSGESGFLRVGCSFVKSRRFKS